MKQKARGSQLLLVVQEVLLVNSEDHSVIIARNQKVNLLATFELRVSLDVFKSTVIKSGDQVALHLLETLAVLSFAKSYFTRKFPLLELDKVRSDLAEFPKLTVVLPLFKSETFVQFLVLILIKL